MSTKGKSPLADAQVARMSLTAFDKRFKELLKIISRVFRSPDESG